LDTYNIRIREKCTRPRKISPYSPQFTVRADLLRRWPRAVFGEPFSVYQNSHARPPRKSGSRAVYWRQVQFSGSPPGNSVRLGNPPGS